MLNNDVLRRLRFMLKLTEARVCEMLKTVDCDVSPQALEAFLAKEEDEHFKPLDDATMAAFLDALVIAKRGPNPDAPKRELELPVTNNQILKKLRIAFELKEQDLLDLMASVDFNISKSELSALFRREGQSNYRACGDQFLRQFLKALTLKMRPDVAAEI